MTGALPPASGNARVCAAVSLGWQMAKLYHSPVHMRAAADPDRSARLPGIPGFPAATESKWLAEQIDATVTGLLRRTTWPRRPASCWRPAGWPRSKTGWSSSRPCCPTMPPTRLCGYLAAARQIAKRAIIAARWPILIAVLAAAGVIITVVTLPSVSPTARLAAGLAWVGATLAAAFKASGSLLGSAVKRAEGWLWQTELDESVATVATRLPAPARHRRVTGAEVGTMTFSTGELFAADDRSPVT